MNDRQPIIQARAVGGNCQGSTTSWVFDTKENELLPKRKHAGSKTNFLDGSLRRAFEHCIDFLVLSLYCSIHVLVKAKPGNVVNISATIPVNVFF